MDLKQSVLVFLSLTQYVDSHEILLRASILPLFINRNKYNSRTPPLRVTPHQLPTGHNGPLRRGNNVYICVHRCKCLCMCVCVFVWHGWSEECSGSRLAEPSQWTGSFTLQGNSTLIWREREREREKEGDAKSKCLQLSKKQTPFYARLWPPSFHLYPLCGVLCTLCDLVIPLSLQWTHTHTPFP